MPELVENHRPPLAINNEQSLIKIIIRKKSNVKPSKSPILAIYSCKDDKIQLR